MNDSGFSLVEALVALALAMTVTGTAMALVMPASRASMTQPEVMDVQQRARVAAEMIARDVSAAGAGVSAGARRGVLPLGIPAVLPRRLGGQSGDGPSVARATAITTLTVPIGSPVTTTAAAISASSLLLTVNAAPSCGSAPLCGLLAGQDVLVRDDAEHFDVFRITRIAGGAATLRHHGQDLSWTYPTGAAVSQVVSRTFEFDASVGQLRQYDGDQSDQPAVDALSEVSFSYLGSAPGSPGLVTLPLSMFVDGPWMGSGTTKFDADLLRVRAIRIRVTAQAADVRLRSRVPAFGVSIAVAPRNLSVGR